MRIRTAARLLTFGIFVVSNLSAQDYLLTTIAGGAPPPTPILASQTSVGSPRSIIVDGVGNLYFVALQCVFKIDTNGVMWRVAGTGRAGFSGDGGPATQAQFFNPMGVTIDPSGTLYVADAGNYRIRKISASGVITTIAGNGTSATSGDGGPAATAEFLDPEGVVADGHGNLYVVDTRGGVIRKISAAGIVTTILTTVTPVSIAVDGSGNPYIGLFHSVEKIGAAGTVTLIAGGSIGNSGDGGPATAAALSSVEGITFDSAGNLYITDQGNDNVRKVSTGGIISTVAGNGRGFSGDGGPAINAQLAQPFSVAADPDGNVYIGENVNRRIRRVSPSGTITTFAGTGDYAFYGDGGPANGTPLPDQQLKGIAIDPVDGSLYLADAFNGRVRRIVPGGTITTVAGSGGNGIVSATGDNGPATSAKFRGVSGVAKDAKGNLYIADFNDNRIRKVSPDGIISAFAGTGTAGYSGDGGPATAAKLFNPSDLALDVGGNLYVADYQNGVVRKISPAGIITTVAGNGLAGNYAGDGVLATKTSLRLANGIALDGQGNLYIADFVGSGTPANYHVRKVSPAGTITTVAGNGVYGDKGDGGPAVNAGLSDVVDVAVDSDGSIYLAETNLIHGSDPNHRIRKVSTAGIITTIAGTGDPGYSGDGGPARNLRINHTFSIAVDGKGNVYLIESGAIRMLSPAGSGCVSSLSSSILQASAAGDSFNLAITSTCSWSVFTLPDWINTSSGTGTGPATIKIGVFPNNGAARSAKISVAGVTVTVFQDALTQIADGGMVNAASFAKDADGRGAPAAPGSLVSIFGAYPGATLSTAATVPYPKSLGGVNVFFDGIPAPIQGVYPAGPFPFIVAQVPFGVQATESPRNAKIVVTVNGIAAPAADGPVVSAAPGIFTIPPNGQATGILVFQDPADSVIKIAAPVSASSSIGYPTAPISRGARGFFYATGLGSMTPPVADGDGGVDPPVSHFADNSFQVLIGGVAAKIEFAGQAPGSPGINQINIVVPDDAPTGDSVSLQVLTADGSMKSNFAQIAVK